MIMAFLLVVIVSGEVGADDRMLFKSIYRCNEFAAAIEEGRVRPDHLKRHRMQSGGTAYCVPKMVNQRTELFE